MKSQILKCFVFVLCIQTFACTPTTKEINYSIQEYPNIDRQLWKHFAEFEIAAAKRGYDVDFNALEIAASIKTIEAKNVVGVCNYSPNLPNEIVIDDTYWKRASDFRRELIVFHEIGHCILNRMHNDGKSDSGECISIMRSGSTGCMDFYNKKTRDIYLDELFN